MKNVKSVEETQFNAYHIFISKCNGWMFVSNCPLVGPGTVGRVPSMGIFLKRGGGRTFRGSVTKEK